MDPRKRMEFLAGELLRHQHLYYVRARPEISDAEYDRLLDELLLLEKKHPQFASPNSPSRRVGSDLDNTFPERPHTVPVLSLDKIYRSDDLQQWLLKTAAISGASVGFTVEEKIDGASIVLYYDRGELAYALTRGNGFSGNDVSDNVRTISQVPLRIAETGRLAVRGEIYIQRADFERYNAGLAEKYANPRNLAAGSLRNLKSAQTARVPLNIFVYEGFFQTDLKAPLGRTEGPRGDAGRDQLDILQRLRELGFRVNPELGYFSDDPGKRLRARQLFPGLTAAPLAAVDDYLRRRTETRKERALRYRRPGRQGRRTGAPPGIGHHLPPSALGAGVQVRLAAGPDRAAGRAGPGGAQRPGDPGGAAASRGALGQHRHAGHAAQPGLHRHAGAGHRRRGQHLQAGRRHPGRRRGAGKKREAPLHLQAARALPVLPHAAGQGGRPSFLQERSLPRAPPARARAIFAPRTRWTSRPWGKRPSPSCTPRAGCGPSPTCTAFDYGTLAGEEGFKEKKIARIRASIEKSKSRPFVRVLAALGFEGLAAAVAGDLIAHGFDDIDKIIAVAARGDWETFAAIEGIGEATARQLVGHFSKPENLDLIARLKQAGLKFAAEPSGPSRLDDSFAGQVWVITGSFEKFSPRSLAAEEIEKRGGKVADNVSARTTHLLAGAHPGSKRAKAEKLGIPIVTESEFSARLAKREK